MAKRIVKADASWSGSVGGGILGPSDGGLGFGGGSQGIGHSTNLPPGHGGSTGSGTWSGSVMTDEPFDNKIGMEKITEWDTEELINRIKALIKIGTPDSLDAARELKFILDKRMYDLRRARRTFELVKTAEKSTKIAQLKSDPFVIALLAEHGVGAYELDKIDEIPADLNHYALHDLVHRIIVAGLEEKIPVLSKKYNISEEEVRNLANYDPTNTKSYLDWLIRHRQELRDQQHTEDVLKVFEKAKKSQALTKKDINQYKTFDELETTLHSIPEEQLETTRGKERKQTETGQKVVYNEPPYKVLEVTTPEAMAHLARNTEWCVKDPKFFGEYEPPFYMVLKNGQPYVLIHRPSGQVKDIEDEEVYTKVLTELTPIFKTLFNINHPALISPSLAVDYAQEVIGGRWPEGEKIIKQDPSESYRYAVFVIKGRWPEGEETIKQDPDVACEYARNIIGGRWPEGEEVIKKDAHCAYHYARGVIKGRWPEGEEAIKQKPLWARDYAKYVIKGRWPEGEEAIKRDPGIWDLYSKEFLVTAQQVKGFTKKAQQDNVRCERLDTIGDTDVWLVDGRLVREKYFVDFTQGGNHERYDWIPDNELWIDDDLSVDERPFVIAHEFLERYLMKDAGMSYDEAHTHADELEKYLRVHEPEVKEGQTTQQPIKGKCPESGAVRYMSVSELVQHDYKAPCPEGPRRLKKMKSVSIEEYKKHKSKKRKSKKASDHVGIKSFTKTAAQPQAMEDLFKERTAKHISLVKKYLDRLEKHYPWHFTGDHDKSKYDNPEHEPYLYITWKHKMKDEDEDWEIPEEWKDKCDEATFHHIKTNKHHPEYWDSSLIENPPNKEDRDEPSGKVVDATKMPKKHILEMVADWCAMSEEKGNTPKEWADKNIGVRWEFSPGQKELIYEAIDLVWDKKKEAGVKGFTRHAKNENAQDEKAIAQDPEKAWRYAYTVIKGRWPEGEEAIKREPVTAYSYAFFVIKGSWPEGEEAIKRDPYVSYLYARDVIKGRWPEGEKAIKRDPKATHYYAKEVIKGEWPEAEEVYRDSLNKWMRLVSQMEQSFSSGNLEEGVRSYFKYLPHVSELYPSKLYETVAGEFHKLRGQFIEPIYEEVYSIENTVSSEHLISIIQKYGQEVTDVLLGSESEEGLFLDFEDKGQGQEPTVLTAQDFYDFYTASLSIDLLDSVKLPGAFKDYAEKAIIPVVEGFIGKLLRAARIGCHMELVHFLGVGQGDNISANLLQRMQKLEKDYGSVQKFDQLRQDRKLSWDQIIDLFQYPGWALGYGKEAWAVIAKAATRLEQLLPIRNNLKETVVQADHLIDLEHNSGLFLQDYVEIPRSNDEYKSLEQFLNEKNEWSLDFMSEQSPQLLRVYKNLQRYAKVKGFTKKSTTEMYGPLTHSPESFKSDVMQVKRELEKIETLTETTSFAPYKVYPLLAQIERDIQELASDYKDMYPRANLHPDIVELGSLFQRLEAKFTSAVRALEDDTTDVRKLRVRPAELMKKLEDLKAEKGELWVDLILQETQMYLPEMVEETEGEVIKRHQDFFSTKGLERPLAAQDFYDFYAATLSSALLNSVKLPTGWAQPAREMVLEVVNLFGDKLLRAAKDGGTKELAHILSGTFKPATGGRYRSLLDRVKSIEDTYTTVEEFNKLRSDRKLAFEEMAKLFTGEWGPAFGGKPWANIMEEAAKLQGMLPATMDNLGFVITQIDHIVDLEHNTDLFLDDYVDLKGQDKRLDEFLSEKTERWDLSTFQKYSPRFYNLYKNLQRYAGGKQFMKIAKYTITFTPKEQQIIDIVKEAAQELDIKCYLVGGAVRDRLLGKENVDLDFMCEEGAEKLAMYLANKYKAREPIQYDRSKAVMVTLGNQTLDFINAERLFRPLKQEAGLEGDEEFTTSFDDAYRRDLTINTLMYDIVTGELLDPTGKGLKDLQNKQLNTVIDPFIKYRIHASDMLRALRFAATLGFKLGSNMLEAMKENAERVRPRDVGGDISNRRVRRELRKAIDKPEHWAKMRELLQQAGLDILLADDVEDVQMDFEGASEFYWPEEDKGAKAMRIKRFTKQAGIFDRFLPKKEGPEGKAVTPTSGGERTQYLTKKLDDLLRHTPAEKHEQTIAKFLAQYRQLSVEEKNTIKKGLNWYKRPPKAKIEFQPVRGSCKKAEKLKRVKKISPTSLYHLNLCSWGVLSGLTEKSQKLEQCFELSDYMIEGSFYCNKHAAEVLKIMSQFPLA